MYKVQNEQEGFTFIEMLITLSIISIILFIVVPIQITLIHKEEKKHFLDTLAYDMLFMQNSEFGDWQGIVLELTDYGYRIDKQNDEIITKRYLPEGWKWQDRNRRNLIFKQNGNFVNPRELKLKTNKKDIHIIFPMGKGRFYVK